MSKEEQYALLATDRMLVRYPIVVGEDFVLAGFKEAGWTAVKKLSKLANLYGRINRFCG